MTHHQPPIGSMEPPTGTPVRARQQGLPLSPLAEDLLVPEVAAMRHAEAARREMVDHAKAEALEAFSRALDGLDLDANDLNGGTVAVVIGMAEDEADRLRRQYGCPQCRQSEGHKMDCSQPHIDRRKAKPEPLTIGQRFDSERRWDERFKMEKEEPGSWYAARRAQRDADLALAEGGRVPSSDGPAEPLLTALQRAEPPVPEHQCIVGERDGHPHEAHEWWYTSSGGGHQMVRDDPTERSTKQWRCPGIEDVEGRPLQCVECWQVGPHLQHCARGKEESPCTSD